MGRSQAMVEVGQEAAELPPPLLRYRSNDTKQGKHAHARLSRTEVSTMATLGLTARQHNTKDRGNANDERSRQGARKV